MIKTRFDKMCDLLWKCREERPDVRTYLAAVGFGSFFNMAFGQPLDLLSDLDMESHCYMAVEALATSPPVYKLFSAFMPLVKRLPNAILTRVSVHVTNVFALYQVITSVPMH